jgi:SAM-dependent methyltransferase
MVRACSISVAAPVGPPHGSPGLAAEARRRYGLEVRVAPFEALEAEGRYDGIWASFCLLHAPRAELGAHLARLARALRPGGLLYLGMKEGAGEARDRLGRRYSYFSGDELRAALAAAGLAVEAVAREHGRGYAGGEETFLHIHARREAAP